MEIVGIMGFLASRVEKEINDMNEDLQEVKAVLDKLIEVKKLSRKKYSIW